MTFSSWVKTRLRDRGVGRRASATPTIGVYQGRLYFVSPLACRTIAGPPESCYTRPSTHMKLPSLPRSRRVNGTTPPASGPSTNDKILFWASFFTLIAAGIGFSVRGVEILKDWGNQFGFTQAELGSITGGGLVGFGIAIIFFSFCADRFGYGKLMLTAFLLHTASAVVTFAATPVFNSMGKEGAYWCLYIGMWLFALGNGTCEAVINPLTATLFPNNKTHWLNILHAGWPGGLVLGAVIVLGFNASGQPIRWEMKLGVFLIPVPLYGLMMFNRVFLRSEASPAGVPLSEMMRTVGMLGVALAVGLFGLLLNNE